MTDKNDSRRKLLKSIATGSGAVIAGKAMPESWTKPVIDSVMLPAHAVTTDDTGSGGPGVTTTLAPCSSSLVIAGDMVSCGDGSTERARNYYVDDTGRCPELIQISGGGSPPSPAHDLNVLVRIRDDGQLWASFGTQGNKPDYIDQQCGNESGGAQQRPYNTSFTALSGAQWSAVFTLSSTDSNPIQARVSNITLTLSV